MTGLTTGIRISCTNKRKLFVTYRCSKDPSFKLYYKKYCMILFSVIAAAKKMYFDELILKSTNKCKTTWNIVKTVTNNGNNPNNIASMNINNNLISNPVTIANAFNAYFSSVAGNLIKNFSGNNYINYKDPLLYLSQTFRKLISSIRLNNTTTGEINKIIYSLKCKDSYGYDEILTRILKISAPYILSPLTYIFNKILSTGIFPERLKISEVKPLFKKGSTTEFSNYRPISL